MGEQEIGDATCGAGRDFSESKINRTLRRTRNQISGQTGARQSRATRLTETLDPHFYGRGVCIAGSGKDAALGAMIEARSAESAGVTGRVSSHALVFGHFCVEINALDPHEFETLVDDRSAQLVCGKLDTQEEGRGGFRCRHVGYGYKLRMVSWT